MWLLNKQKDETSTWYIFLLTQLQLEVHKQYSTKFKWHDTGAYNSDFLMSVFKTANRFQISEGHNIHYIQIYLKGRLINH